MNNFHFAKLFFFLFPMLTVCTLLGCGLGSSQNENIRQPLAEKLTVDHDSVKELEKNTKTSTKVSKSPQKVVKSTPIKLVKCTGTQLFNKKTTAELEKLSTTDPCAMEQLAHRYFRDKMTSEWFVKGAHLLQKAHDSGLVSRRTPRACTLFYYGLGTKHPDTKRAAQCYERANEGVELAFLYATGQGVDRDFDRAQSLLDSATSGGGDRWSVRRILERERAKVSTKKYDYCTDVAGTTFSEADCRATKLYLVHWKQSQYIDHRLKTISTQEKAAFDPLVESFLAFEGADRGVVYYSYGAGSGRSMGALWRVKKLREEFYDLFEKTVAQRKLPDVTSKQLFKARAHLAKQNKANSTIKGSRFVDTAVYANKYAKAQKAWKNYVKAWITFGSPLLVDGTGKSLPRKKAQRYVEGYLVESRIKVLE